MWLTGETNIPESISGRVRPSAGGGEAVFSAAGITSASLLQLRPVSNGIWMGIYAFLLSFMLVSLLLAKQI